MDIKDLNKVKLWQNKELECKSLPLTPERRERMKQACYSILKVLIEETENPMEGYAVLTKMLEGLEECCGIKGMVSMKNGNIVPDGKVQHDA